MPQRNYPHGVMVEFWMLLQGSVALSVITVRVPLLPGESHKRCAPYRNQQYYFRRIYWWKWSSWLSQYFSHRVTKKGCCVEKHWDCCCEWWVCDRLTFHQVRIVFVHLSQYVVVYFLAWFLLCFDSHAIKAKIRPIWPVNCLTRARCFSCVIQHLSSGQCLYLPILRR